LKRILDLTLYDGRPHTLSWVARLRWEEDGKLHGIERLAGLAEFGLPSDLGQYAFEQLVEEFYTDIAL